VILDDEPHCNGEGCDVRGGCLRYVALLHKRGTGRVLSYWMPEEPKTCHMFWAMGSDTPVPRAPMTGRQFGEWLQWL
jgi:hypothetical protein